MTEPQYTPAQNQPYAPPGGPPSQPNAPWPAQPPGGPWQGQPPTPRKRSWFARHKILTGLLALVGLIVVVGIASGGGGDTAGSGGESSASADGDGDGDGGKVGSPIRDGKFEFTVTTVRCGVPSVGTAGVGQTAQGQFCLVSLKVTNIGDKAQTLDASSQYAYDAQGRKLSSDSAAGLFANEAGGGAFLNEINPGNSATAVVVFDIPKGAELTRLELHDSPFSGGADVAVS